MARTNQPSKRAKPLRDSFLVAENRSFPMSPPAWIFICFSAGFPLADDLKHNQYKFNSHRQQSDKATQ
jgi:hypothetical protein